MNVTELIGYGASVLIVVSLAMKSILRLRVIGLVGSVVFVGYGALIGSIPIIITNAVIAGIHAVFLARIARLSEAFSIVAAHPGEPYLDRFLAFHADDITALQPEFDGSIASSDDAVFVLRDLVPAGLFVTRDHGSDLEVVLDYVIPSYRDFKVGTWIYSGSSGVVDAHHERVWTRPGSDVHRRYLARMGFVTSGERMVLELVR